MATFESTGHTVFREGDPAIPDISGEKKGRRPGVHGYSSVVVAGHTTRGGGKKRLKRVRLRVGRTRRLVFRILGGRSRKR